MALIEEELKIIRIRDLVEKKLIIPEYQRPYRWNKQTVLTLFNDLFAAYENNPEKEYRIGTVILFNKDTEYEIVDGQQRITTLALLFLASGTDVKDNLLNLKYNDLSFDSLQTNYTILKNKFNTFSLKEKKYFVEYIKEKCTMVQIVVDGNKNEFEGRQEAFQFFDSQNTRGKSLAPHDLLKSYHLREMNDDKVDVKIKVITEWENTKQNELEILFREYLFPITQWFKGRNGLGYSSKNIHAFKGININNTFNYAIYHKASNIFIEQTNRFGATELISSEPLNQFQLTQPLIAGKRFFQYAMHYNEMIKNIEVVVNAKMKHLKGGNTSEYLPQERTGDRYIYRLFLCAVIFFVDKFGLNQLNDSVIKKIYVWAYSLRLSMHSVYSETINKYALGEHSRIKNKNIFAYINEMAYPQDLELLVFEYDIYENNNKYQKIIDCIKEFTGDDNE